MDDCCILKILSYKFSSLIFFYVQTRKVYFLENLHAFILENCRNQLAGSPGNNKNVNRNSQTRKQSS